MGEHWHNYQDWLHEKRRDAQGRPVGHPAFDPSTLRLPSMDAGNKRAWNMGKGLTSASKQWWKIKSQYADCILFFKVGKFYELFHMDADVGVKFLSSNEAGGKPFIYMKGMKAHAGFPEISYGKFSKVLVDNGYKVARVEQIQKADDLERGQKVVRRDVVAIVTPGTRTQTYLDAKLSDEVEPAYLLAITERALESGEQKTGNDGDRDTVAAVCEYGVTFVDSMTGGFRVGLFEDGPQRNRLRTLLAKIRPKEIVYEIPGLDGGNDDALSEETMSILRSGSHPDAVLTPTRSAVATGSLKACLVQSKYGRKSKRRAWHAADTVAFFERTYKRIDTMNAAEEGGVRESTAVTSRAIWPWVLRCMLDETEGASTANLSPDGRCKLAWRALGGMFAHLSRCQIAFQLLDQGSFDAYVPSDMMSASSGGNAVPVQDAIDGSGVLAAVGGQIAAAEEGATTGAGGEAATPTFSGPGSNFMSMDVHAIRNLEIFENTYDQGKEGTLCSFLNHCSTSAGRRLFRRWLAEPLCRSIAIHRRLDAVEDLMAIGDIRDEMRADLSRLPDLERLESSIHSMGSKYLASEHEMHKAVMYETSTYRLRKTKELNAALSGFERANELVLDFREQIVNGGITLRSDTLRMLLGVTDEGGSGGGGAAASATSRKSDGTTASGSWPDLTSIVEGLRVVAPKPRPGKDRNGNPHPTVIQLGNGKDPELDRLKTRAKEIENEVYEFVKDAKRELGERSLAVWGKGKNRWQIECPDKLSVPSSWKYNSKKKGKKRYYPARIARLKDEDDKLAEKIEEVEQDRFRKVFRRFSRHHNTWKRAIRALSRLDALMSLSVASDLITEGADGVSDQPVCRPEFVEDGTQVLELRNARHPCIAQTFSGNGFIPNDTILGGGGAEDGESCTSNASANCLLLTGPNMGGKSTVLRQTCVCVIMAQLGCYVPATKCRLSPVDRIFTRIGASDNILEGQSTFFVELSETSTILHEATPSSLVILDELGRGTSTFDGVAIAHSVVQKLAEDLGCRTMFATHYHSLVDEFGAHPNVALANMACKVMDKSEDDVLQEGKTSIDSDATDGAGPDANVMFLYKLVGGACTKSYGLNVARLARLPEPVLAKANAKSKEFESTMVAAARESLASAIMRAAKEIQDTGSCTPSLYKKLATLWGQAKTVTGKNKKKKKNRF